MHHEHRLNPNQSIVEQGPIAGRRFGGWHEGTFRDTENGTVQRFLWHPSAVGRALRDDPIRLTFRPGYGLYKSYWPVMEMFADRARRSDRFASPVIFYKPELDMRIRRELHRSRSEKTSLPQEVDFVIFDAIKAQARVFEFLAARDGLSQLPRIGAFGDSFGGYLQMEWAAAHPSSVVLLNPNGSVGTGISKNFVRTVTELTRSTVHPLKTVSSVKEALVAQAMAQDFVTHQLRNGPLFNLHLGYAAASSDARDVSRLVGHGQTIVFAGQGDLCSSKEVNRMIAERTQAVGVLVFQRHAGHSYLPHLETRPDVKRAITVLLDALEHCEPGTKEPLDLEHFVELRQLGHFTSEHRLRSLEIEAKAERSADLGLSRGLDIAG